MGNKNLTASLFFFKYTKKSFFGFSDILEKLRIVEKNGSQRICMKWNRLQNQLTKNVIAK